MKITHYVQIYVGQFAENKDVKQLFCESHGVECLTGMLNRGEYWNQMYQFETPIDGECSWCRQNKATKKLK